MSIIPAIVFLPKLNRDWGGLPGCVALQETEKLGSTNWKEISYLLDQVKLLDALLTEV